MKAAKKPMHICLNYLCFEWNLGLAMFSHDFSVLSSAMYITYMFVDEGHGTALKLVWRMQ